MCHVEDVELRREPLLTLAVSLEHLLYMNRFTCFHVSHYGFRACTCTYLGVIGVWVAVKKLNFRYYNTETLCGVERFLLKGVGVSEAMQL